MPNSVREGTRPSAVKMRLYSSAVMLCCASNSGVTATGSGTTAEEAVVITIASIVAWDVLQGGEVSVWESRPLADIPKARVLPFRKLAVLADQMGRLNRPAPDS